MLLSLLFKCLHCNSAPSGASFPLCSTCANSLIFAPALCSKCASVHCPQHSATCLRPWAASPRSELIAGYTANYLLIGKSYSVLKKWKTRQSPLFHRQVLKLDPSVYGRLKEFGADGITYVPSSMERVFSLGGSPAESIAQWLAKILHLKLSLALLPPRQKPDRRQGERSQQERIQSRILFERGPDLSDLTGKKVILVDDFFTTGRTIRQCVEILAGAQPKKVMIYCLGIRPQFEKSSSSLLWPPHLKPESNLAP